jgi:hypothetical protein
MTKLVQRTIQAAIGVIALTIATLRAGCQQDFSVNGVRLEVAASTLTRQARSRAIPLVGFIGAGAVRTLITD